MNHPEARFVVRNDPEEFFVFSDEVGDVSRGEWQQFNASILTHKEALLVIAQYPELNPEMVRVA